MNFTQVVCILLILILNYTNINAGTGTWKVYTYKAEIRDIAVSQGILWAVTSGGMFSYNLSHSRYKEFTTSEGLRTIDLTAITVDSKGIIWVGASNGLLHSFNPKTNTWHYITDILRDADPNKRINKLYSSGDSLYILSDLGLSLLSISKLEFIETCRRFGVDRNQIQGRVTSFQTHDNRIWVGTRQGIACTPVTNRNLSNPELWQVFKLPEGLPSERVRGLVSTAGELFAATEGGIAKFNSGKWQIIPQTLRLNILDIKIPPTNISDTGVFYFITADKLFKYTGEAILELYGSFPSALTTLHQAAVIGTLNNGILIKNDTGWVSIVPSGPPTNLFSSILFDENGVLWTATSRSDENAKGFFSFDGSKWESYTKTKYPILESDRYYKISLGKDNSKWISSWGTGVAVVNSAGNIIKVLNINNGLLPTIEPSYVVVGGIATDKNGVTWITNRTPPPDTALVLFHPDSTITYVKGLNLRESPTIFTDIVIDQYGTKWFANFSRFESVLPKGLYFFNENINLPGANNGWGFLTTADGLTSNIVWSLLVGNDGELWVGTDKGVTIIFDPRYPQTRMANYHPLPDQTIQAMVSDPLNNKWLATKNGVFLLSSDGTSILDYYTVENTQGKLLDNDVASIAIDRKRGIVYFGTEKGLSSLETYIAEPLKSFNKLIISPNPYIIPSEKPLLIDGLVRGSIIKILAADGTLIQDIITPGGRIGVWNGRDKNGNLVSTAVYIVVASSEQENGVAIGKIAIIRR